MRSGLNPAQLVVPASTKGCLGESEFFDMLECVFVLRQVDERVGNAEVFKDCHGVGHIVMFSICVDRYVFAHDVLFLSTINFFAFWREKSIAIGSAEVPGRGIPQAQRGYAAKARTVGTVGATMIGQKGEKRRRLHSAAERLRQRSASVPAQPWGRLHDLLFLWFVLLRIADLSQKSLPSLVQSVGRVKRAEAAPDEG